MEKKISLTVENSRVLTEVIAMRVNEARREMFPTAEDVVQEAGE